MALQTIYTQVNNAKIEPCKKGKPIPPLAIPLIRNNYLGEYRTQVERDKVLKNLGILGATGNYTYPSEESVSSYKDIKTVKQALDYCIRLIQSYEQSDKNITQLITDVKAINNQIDTIISNINDNTSSITEISKQIEVINQSISEFDQKLKDLNVDDKITNRINQHLENSKTIELQENTLEVKKSNVENNALQINDDGLFIQDISEQVNENTEAIKKVSNSDKYITNINGSSPYTIGGIKEGTTAESLNGKSISDILDLMLFPTYVRDLIYPSLQFTPIQNLVEVNSEIIKPSLEFNQGDAGEAISQSISITYNGLEYSQQTYTNIGQYIFNGSVSYNAGEYLVNNKGELTSQRIEAGTIETQTNVIATYPWYVGNTNQTTKQELIPFNQISELEINLSDNAVIKLPGANSQLISFKVNGGLGYLDVDLNGWKQSTEQINGYIYKIWTKTDAYSNSFPHKIQFKLVQ